MVDAGPDEVCVGVGVVVFVLDYLGCFVAEEVVVGCRNSSSRLR